MKWTATLLVAFLSVTSGCSGRKSKGVEIPKKEPLTPPSSDSPRSDNDPLSNAPGDFNNDGFNQQNNDFGSPPGTYDPYDSNPYNSDPYNSDPYNSNPGNFYNNDGFDQPFNNPGTPPGLNNPFNPDFSNPDLPNPDNPGDTNPPYVQPDFNNPGRPGNPGAPNIPGTPQGNNGDLNINFDFNDPNLTTWDGKSDVTNGNFRIIDVP